MDKDKIFIIVYIDVRRIAREDISAYMESVRRAIKMDETVLLLIIPIEDETRVECINPVLLTEEEYKKAETTLSELKEQVEKFLSEKEKP